MFCRRRTGVMIRSVANYDAMTFHILNLTFKWYGDKRRKVVSEYPCTHSLPAR